MTMDDLHPLRDPDLLLRALYGVPRARQPALVDAIARLLDHHEAFVREEALRILVTRWKEAAYRGRAAGMLVSDPSAEVRGAAAFALGASADDATRREHTDLLVQVLRNAREEAAVRGAAYDALLILYRNPAFPTKRREFDPGLDVDWPWIRSLQG